MKFCILSSFWLFGSIGATPVRLHPIQYSISRRGGSFPSPDVADLPHLLEQLQIAESRFLTTTLRKSLTTKVIRRPKHHEGTLAEATLSGEVGRNGNWFATLDIGKPLQHVNMDLDMLTSDFFIWSTTSNQGSWFFDFTSASYVLDAKLHPFPGCHQPTDIIHLPTLEYSIPITFAHCRPPKSWIRTLLPSGAYLGLAPTLHQIRSPHLFEQLLENNLIEKPLWSLSISNSSAGIFTMGVPRLGHEQPDRAHQDIRPIKLVAEDEIIDGGIRRHFKGTTHYYNWKKDWTWSKLRGPEGWLQLEMRGLWLYRTLIMQNQDVILDVNTPFILAPLAAVHTLYSSIPEAKHLPPPYDQFFSYPCLNPPQIQVQFGGNTFHVLRNKSKKGSSDPDGRFSLGRLQKESKFCVGAVVEGRFDSSANGDDAGMRDTWILGEDFFRNVEVLFDWEENHVGMRNI